MSVLGLDRPRDKADNNGTGRAYRKAACTEMLLRLGVQLISRAHVNHDKHAPSFGFHPTKRIKN